MRRSHKSCRPNFHRRLVLVAVFSSFFVLLPASAQKASGNDASGPKYDLHTETTVKGTVEELKLPPKANEIAHLALKTGSGTINVYLCPKSFLEDMGLSFSKGEEIAVTGSKVKQDGADLVLARSVEKGNDTVTFRDDKGTPVWSWQRKN
jgi:DNA/RNA endonuclease YhcR with UshA esterase domain